MNERNEHSTLHVGLLSLDRKKLLSPNDTAPQLFTYNLNEQSRVGIESQAKEVLKTCGIVTSSLRSLSSADEFNHGYLLRESHRVDLDEKDLRIYTQNELLEFISDEEPADVRSQFLRQIVRWMN